jgi:hypothetical protein
MLWGVGMMDPITTAIMAVLPGLASDTLKAVVKSSYEGLKAVILRKWGEGAPISKAIKAVEEDPTSKAQAGVLAEKVEAVQANKDPDVAQALQKLIDQLKSNGIGGEAVAKIQIKNSGQIIGPVGNQNVTIGTFNAGVIPKRL